MLGFRRRPESFCIVCFCLPGLRNYGILDGNDPKFVYISEIMYEIIIEAIPKLSLSVRDPDVSGDADKSQRKSSISEDVTEFVWPSGAHYIGDVVDGKRTGKGKQTWPSGSVYEGRFLNDMRHGYGRSVWESGEVRNSYPIHYFTELVCLLVACGRIYIIVTSLGGHRLVFAY